MSEPSAHTPSFRGRGRGRGRSQAVRAHVARLAQARKAANGRRGRQKLYDHPKPQAASERLKELKAAFSTVANALRPALEDLADRNLDALKASSNAYRAVPEYDAVKSFLDARYRDEQHINDSRLSYDTRLKDYLYECSSAITRNGFIRDIEDAKDRFYDAQLQRLDILERLHDNELPIDIVDDSWNFCELSDERFLDVKAYIEYRTDFPSHPVYGNKVEVPCSKIITGPRLASSDSAQQASSKRKSEDDAYVLPAPKRLIGGAVPRHISGLLSGVVAPTDADDDDDAEGAGSPGPDSKRPSPTPQPADEEDDMLDDDDNGTPAADEDGTVFVKPSERLPPLPNGASEPDAYDVRLVNKRRTANFDVYNRILVPSLFDFEAHEIGFRDSTNDKSRGATKIKRGRFLGTPNSNTMHFDRSLWQYDATTYDDGELDDALVKKHNLHPKYGLVLRSSINEEEPPKQRVSGKHPVVFYTPNGRTLNSSRSIHIARLEDGAVASAQRPAIAAAVDKFIEEQGVAADDVCAPADLVKDYREAKLKLWLGPRRVIRDETEEQEEHKEQKEDEQEEVTEDTLEIEGDADEQPVAAQDQSEQDEADPASASAAAPAAGDRPAGMDTFGVLLDAVSSITSGAASDDASGKISPSVENHSTVLASSASPPPPPRRAASKPFDPVRDVFMNDAPPPADVEQHRQGSTDFAPAPDPRTEIASALLLMAGAASDRDYAPEYSRHQSHSSQPPAPTSSYPYPHQPLPPSRVMLRYPSSRDDSPEYAASEAGPASYPPPMPRSMSIDTSQQPYHHQAPPPPAPPQHEATLLDPRLFGDAAHQQPSDAVPPPYNTGRELGNGYSGNGHYQQPPPSYMHSSAPADPYGPPASSHGSQGYYMSPPPQHMMRPYDNQYGPLPQPPPPSSAYSSQAPPYARSNSREYQPTAHPYNGNGNGYQYGADATKNGSNGSNGMHRHDSNGDVDRRTASPRRSPRAAAAAMSAMSASPAASTGKELRTRPYDYEKAIDYEHSEAPARSWPHTNSGGKRVSPVKVEATPEWNSHARAPSVAPIGSDDEK